MKVTVVKKREKRDRERKRYKGERKNDKSKIKKREK